jgi:hypothetical protein
MKIWDFFITHCGQVFEDLPHFKQIREGPDGQDGNIYEMQVLECYKQKKAS